MVLVGHQHQRSVLAAASEVPSTPVALVGPSGIGKALLAEAAARYAASSHDVAVYRSTRMDDVRELSEWAIRPPLEGSLRAAVVDIDGSAPSVAQALLKLLEEPPRACWLLLVSSGVLAPTVASRVRQVRCHPLAPGEVDAVLAAAGIVGEEALRLVRVADGRPGRALALRDALAARPRVLTLTTAVSRRDWKLLTTTLRGPWDQAGVTCLGLWLSDVLGDTTKAFAPGERQGLDVRVSRPHLLAAQDALAMGLPPRLAVTLAAQRLMR